MTARGHQPRRWRWWCAARRPPAPPQCQSAAAIRHRRHRHKSDPFLAFTISKHIEVFFCCASLLSPTLLKPRMHPPSPWLDELSRYYRNGYLLLGLGTLPPPALLTPPSLLAPPSLSSPGRSSRRRPCLAARTRWAAWRYDPQLPSGSAERAPPPGRRGRARCLWLATPSQSQPVCDRHRRGVACRHGLTRSYSFVYMGTAKALVAVDLSGGRHGLWLWLGTASISPVARDP